MFNTAIEFHSMTLNWLRGMNTVTVCSLYVIWIEKRRFRCILYPGCCRDGDKRQTEYALHPYQLRINRKIGFRWNFQFCKCHYRHDKNHNSSSCNLTYFHGSTLNQTEEEGTNSDIVFYMQQILPYPRIYELQSLIMLHSSILLDFNIPFNTEIHITLCFFWIYGEENCFDARSK